MKAKEPVDPRTPSQNVFGTVKVVVSVDASGAVTAAAVTESPSTILNQAALESARGSTYRPELRDCVAVPSKYLFAVGFSPLP
jgi:TonB family protein